MEPNNHSEAAIRLLPGAVSDLFAQVSQSQSLSVADRYGLLAAVLEDSLTPEERESIDRILYAARRGRTKFGDDFSSCP